MNQLRQKIQEQKSADPSDIRIAELLRIPAKERIAAIEADIKALPKEISDANVYHRKALWRIWDWARIEAGIVTPEQVQRENSPFKAGELAEAKLTYRPRLRA